VDANLFVPGTILLGKYRIEKLLGMGAMGVVLAATHMGLDQKVAIKFMLPGKTPSPERHARFVREARIAVKLKSLHVGRVLDVGTMEDGGAPYMVMEFLEGSDLGSVLAQRRALPIEEAVGYMLQVCEAVADARADVWSLGVVLYELVAGQTPFHATELTVLLSRIFQGDPTPLSELRSDLPPGLEAVLLRCFEKDREHRRQNAAELAAALVPFGPARALPRAAVVALPPPAPAAPAAAANSGGLDAAVVAGPPSAEATRRSARLVGTFAAAMALGVAAVVAGDAAQSGRLLRALHAAAHGQRPRCVSGGGDPGAQSGRLRARGGGRAASAGRPGPAHEGDDRGAGRRAPALRRQDALPANRRSAEHALGCAVRESGRRRASSRARVPVHPAEIRGLVRDAGGVPLARRRQSAPLHDRHAPPPAGLAPSVEQ
jgi:Protein kinase domain